MSVDRILQLKLMADVSDINRKMDGTSKQVGKVKSAFGGLKSFVGPAIAAVGLQLASGLNDAFQAQIKHARDLANALEGLEAVGKGLKLPEGKLRGLADELRDIGVSLGVGEDAKIVSALRDIVAITKDVELSSTAVQAIFDVMRAFDVDFDTAKNTVINGIILGRSRYLDQLGLSAKTVPGRLREFNKAFGTAAEDFAETSEGKWQVAAAEWDGHMLNLAIVIDDAMLYLKGQLVIAWNNLTDIVDAIARIWAGIEDNWLPPLQAIQAGLVGVWTNILRGARTFGSALERTVKGVANAIIRMLNAMSAAFAFSFTFDIPSFDIPDPTQLLEGGTITIGGGTVDFSRGRLFDTIPLLGQGGIVRSPTLAFIGERGPEAVVPLSSGGLGPTINVYAAVASPADIGRSVVQAIEAYERQGTASWRGA